MDLLMDGLLAAATLFAGGYCWVLARRVRDLKSLDKGLGASIVTLTRQIELARATLDEARGAAKDNKHELGQLIGRAETAAAHLRLLLAAVREPEPMRPEPKVEPPAPPAAPAAAPAEAEAPAAPVIAMTFPPEPQAAPASPASANLPEVPKPRAMPPLESPLRKRSKAGAR